MSETWRPTQWAIDGDLTEHVSPRVEIDLMLSPYYDGERYAVRCMGRCLTRDGEWEREPIPSSRGDDFYARCRFLTFNEAVAAYEKAGPALKGAKR